MASAVHQEMGWWWRFSEYRVVGGRIEPAPGARLSQYDPWADYRASRSRGGNGEPPYQSLLSLLRRIDYRASGRGFVLKPESEAQIARWCSRHGLIGVLPQTIQRIDLPAVARASIPESGVTVRDALRITISAHGRDPAGWSTSKIPDTEIPEKTHPGLITRFIQSGLLKKDHSGQEREPGFVSYSGVIPYDELKALVGVFASRWWQRPGAVQVAGPRLSLDELAKSYFPGVPGEERESFDYPQPLTPGFWHLYSETVKDFLHRAGWLQAALEHIGSVDLADATWSEGEVGDFPIGLDILNFLTGSANRVLGVRHVSLELVWLFPSLLASYAMMIAEDLTQNNALHACSVCDTPFLSKAYQVKYCSDTCRFRAQKRRQRKAEKARRLYEKGWSCEQIAAELGEEPGTINEWLKLAGHQTEGEAAT